jgi:hypothetical protein
MSHSHKNTSSGGHGKDSSGNDFAKIGHKKEHVPPPGASNSYEQVRKKIDAKDDRSLSKDRYTREKMMNK